VAGIAFIVAKKPTLSHRIEFAALRAFTAALSPFGVRGAGRIAGAIAELGYWPFGVRRGVVERQIRAAFPDFDAAKVEAVARESYQNLGRVTVEASLLSAMPAGSALEYFAPSPSWERLEAARALGKGVILISGHIGNWELAAAYIAARKVDVSAIARGMSNPLSDAYIRSTREKLGVHIMHDQEAVRRVPRALRDRHVVGVLSDQATVGLASTFVNFFGRPAKTPRGAAVFALRGDVPVVFLAAVRLPDGRYECVCEDIEITHTGDREKDVDDIIIRFTHVLENLVRKYPGQYFWQHRRWKHQPADTPPELREP
jgi:KDO2-lipid IV(A) lauroyltransferase